MRCPICGTDKIESLGACNCDGEMKFHDFMCEKEHFWTLCINKKTGETEIDLITKLKI